MIKSRMFAAFSLGALAATISLGAVQYVSANGGSSITACANKSTGAMRYISKGSCKKTERKVTWNQQGLQGAQGLQGMSGDDGQNLYAVDATGATIGPVRGLSELSVIVEFQNYFFKLYIHKSEVAGFGDGFQAYYADSQCTIPYFGIDKRLAIAPQQSEVDYGLNQGYDAIDKAIKPIGSSFSLSGKVVYTSNSTACLSLTDQQKSAADDDFKFYQTQEISKPGYVAPLTIVSK